VIASHMSLLFLPGLPLGGAGKSGVYLFFVLSAFLLTRMLLDRDPQAFADTRLWAGYALRWILRIWPLYLVVLGLSWAMTAAGASWWHFQLGDAALLRHLALQEGQSVLWSIPVEFKFYLWLPLVAFILAWMAHRRAPVAVQVAVAIVMLAACMLAWPPEATGRNDVRLGPYLALFLCGCFAAAVDARLPAPSSRSRVAWGIAGLASLLAVAASVPKAWAQLTGTELDYGVNHEWFLFFGLAWSVLLLSSLHGPGWFRWVFSTAPLRLLGVVSFSAYLWHMPVLFGLRAAGARDWAAAPAWLLAAVLVVSMVSFLLVERPWREIRLRPNAKLGGGPRGGARAERTRAARVG